MVKHKKNKRKKISIVGFCFGGLLLIITILFFSLLKMLNIVPNNLFLIGIIVISLLTTIVVSILVFIPKKRNVFLIAVKGLCYLITFGLIGVYCFGTYYLNKTMNFIDNISIMSEEVTNYYVVVLKDAKYQELADLYETSLAYFENTDKDVIEHIKLNLTYTTSYDVSELYDMLVNKDVESLLISDIVKNKMEDDLGDFNNKVKVIETFSIKNKIEDITKKVSIKNTPFNVLISGVDAYGDINQVSRNDVNIVATINPNTNEILLTSIPRDYYVQLNGKSGNKDKLTHASYYGINTQVKTIEDIFDIDINYYVKVNFTTLVELVDELGGIRVYADQYVNLPEGNCTLHKGYNNIDGTCALFFSRERYSYADGDMHRGRNQTEVIKAIFNKVSSSSTLISEYTNILEVLDGKFATNMDVNEVINLVKYEVNDLGDYHFESTQVDGYGSMGYTYSYPGQELWIMIPYNDSINNVKKLINKMLNNESLRK